MSSLRPGNQPRRQLWRIAASTRFGVDKVPAHGPPSSVAGLCVALATPHQSGEQHHRHV